MPLLAMMAGVAAVWAIYRSTHVATMLKWPNDVVVGERKLGGILVESVVAGSRLAHVVVGIGLNVNANVASLGSFGEGAMPATTLLEESGSAVSRETLVTALLEGLDQLYGSLLAGHRAAVAKPYRSFLSTLGQSVRVSDAGHAGERIEGVAEEITDAGALVVRLADGSRRELAHGEVSVRSA
jgi:BirA family biotin operon repressor/biotin-[acetyl-CoA-carboxylase] ligase